MSEIDLCLYLFVCCFQCGDCIREYETIRNNEDETRNNANNTNNTNNANNTNDTNDRELYDYTEYKEYKE